MTKERYIEIINNKLNGNSKDILIKQVERFYLAKNTILPVNNKRIGDKVYLPKGTLLHGTYKNIEGLRTIASDGLISSWFIDGRKSKYPSSVGLWNIQKDISLKDYIDLYSGGTIELNNHLDKKSESFLIGINDLPNIVNIIKDKGYLTWKMEQTKEARFMPSLIQNQVQIGIIFNSDACKDLLHGDILDENNINDIDVKDFVNEAYYDNFIIERKNKDVFFTNRESAILFGVPSNLIEGVLVGRKYENDNNILNEIKDLLPNAYICSLDGIIIK